MTTLAEVKVVTADECGCEFTEDPDVHDYLISLESMPILRACKLIADLIGDEDHYWGHQELNIIFTASQCMFNDPGDFRRFVAQHNWQDPAGMASLAESVQYSSEQAWKTRMRDKSPT
jgi:hypothetical protein